MPRPAQLTTVRRSGVRRAAVLVCIAALLAGCGGSGEQAAIDTSAASMAGHDMAAPAASAAGSLAERAGTWQGHSMPMDKDSVISTWTLVSTADTTGWTITFPDRQPIPVRIASTQGDSVALEFGPYESTMRRGVMQTVRGVSRLQGERLVGSWEARLASAPDSVVMRGRSEATWTP